MHLTLFCDASFCPETKAGGWGAWAKTGTWKEGLLFGGTFKTLLTSCHEAELCAVANALFILNREGHLTGIQTLMIQTDSLRTLGLIKKRLPASQVKNHANGATLQHLPIKLVSEAEDLGLTLIINVTSLNKYVIQLRHVRGHRKGPARQWVNRQCDTLAKKHMRRRRNDLLQGKGV